MSVKKPLQCKTKTYIQYFLERHCNFYEITYVSLLQQTQYAVTGNGENRRKQPTHCVIAWHPIKNSNKISSFDVMLLAPTNPFYPLLSLFCFQLSHAMNCAFLFSAVRKKSEKVYFFSNFEMHFLCQLHFKVAALILFTFCWLFFIFIMYPVNFVTITPSTVFATVCSLHNHSQLSQPFAMHFCICI